MFKKSVVTPWAQLKAAFLNTNSQTVGQALLMVSVLL